MEVKKVVQAVGALVVLMTGMTLVPGYRHEVPVPRPVMEQARKLPGNWCAGRVTGEYDDSFRAAAAKYHEGGHRSWCDLKVQCMQESSLRPSVTSHAGAIGLCQILPGTGDWLGVDPWDPHENVMGAAKYVRWLEDQWYAPRSESCRERLTWASYNAGLGTILDAQRAAHGAPCWDAIGPHTPAETQDYIVKIERIRANWMGDKT